LTSDAHRELDEELTNVRRTERTRFLRVTQPKKLVSVPSVPAFVPTDHRFAMICSGRDDRIEKIETSPLKPKPAWPIVAEGDSLHY
jgi:hypothetical protein